MLKKMTKNKTINLIEIDGSNAGGQVLRTALALSTITRKPFSMNNIRKSRDKPGLRNQHLAAIYAYRDITNALCDAKLNDENIEFYPGKSNSTKEDFDIKTAGSISLFIQSLLPVLINSKKLSNFKVKGGTDVKYSPAINYYKELVLCKLEKLGLAKFELNILKRGFYPKGQGEVELKIRPNKDLKDFKILDNEKGELKGIKIIIMCQKELFRKEMSEDIKKALEIHLGKIKVPVVIQANYCNAENVGISITWYAQFDKESFGYDFICDEKEKPNNIAKIVTEDITKRIYQKGNIDVNLADNLIPFIAIYGGSIKTSEITNHIRTNVDVSNKFLDEGEVLIEELEEGLIEIKKISIV